MLQLCATLLSVTSPAIMKNDVLLMSFNIGN